MDFKIIEHHQNWKTHESIYLTEAEGRAMIRITKYVDDETYMLSDLYVDPVWRENGLGTLMIESAIKKCRAHAQLNDIEQCIIEIAVNDHSAKFCSEWYQRMGFVLNRCEASIDTILDDETEWCDIYRLVV